MGHLLTIHCPSQVIYLYMRTVSPMEATYCMNHAALFIYEFIFMVTLLVGLSALEVRMQMAKSYYAPDPG